MWADGYYTATTTAATTTTTIPSTGTYHYSNIYSHPAQLFDIIYTPSIYGTGTISYGAGTIGAENYQAPKLSQQEKESILSKYHLYYEEKENKVVVTLRNCLNNIIFSTENFDKEYENSICLEGKTLTYGDVELYCKNKTKTIVQKNLGQIDNLKTELKLSINRVIINQLINITKSTLIATNNKTIISIINSVIGESFICLILGFVLNEKFNIPSNILEELRIRALANLGNSAIDEFMKAAPKLNDVIKELPNEIKQDNFDYLLDDEEFADLKRNVAK
ncbi:MAG: hypothetical protein LC122_11940 [Chitinophagales bacterium]|nr:hypothetical protein [Chitinophagales bacterium]